MIERYLISDVVGSFADSGSVVLQLAWADGVERQISMSADVAARLVIAAQDAGADCERETGREPTHVIIDRVAIQASSLPGRAVLSLQSEGGLNLHYLIPDHPIDRI